MNKVTRLHDGDMLDIQDMRMGLFGATTLEQVEQVHQELGAFIQDKQLRVMNDPDNRVVSEQEIKLREAVDASK